MKTRMLALSVSLLGLTVLGGCSSNSERLYYHGDYSAAVYSYFRQDDVTLEEQIETLNQIIEDAANNQMLVAPGVHAHLGMLYFETGSPNLGMQHFEAEKALFPESTQYIDFLIKQAQEA